MLIQGAKIKDIIGEWVTLSVPRHYLDELMNYSPEDLLTVEIKRPRDKRSLQQNRYIWEIISQIDRKINGFRSDEMNIYKQLLKQAKIKSVYFETIESAKPTLEEAFRLVEEHEKRSGKNGVETVVYRCYIGTSQFTKAEMSDFIEALISRAYDEGIDIHHYEDALKGGK